MRTLVVFLGRPEATYTPTRYRFADGHLSDETKFFFAALWRYLERHDHRPQQLLILGSSNSIWSSLSEFDPQLEQLEAWSRLEEGPGNEEDLVAVRTALGEALGCDVKCELIPATMTSDDPHIVLRKIADHCKPGDELSIDVTHGFRLYGQIAVQAAFYLRQVRDARIGGVYYGQFARDAESTGVKLAVDELASWAEALAVMRHTGRLAPVAALLPPELSELRLKLEEIDFGLQASRFKSLKSDANRVANLIEGLDFTTVSAECELALIEIREEIESYRIAHLSDLQVELARRALDTGDWMRCGLFLYEAVCSAGIEQPEDRHRANARANAWQGVRERKRAIGSETARWHDDGDADLLAFVRNTLAHGSLPRKNDAMRKLSSANSIRQFLETQMKHVPRVCNELKARPVI